MELIKALDTYNPKALKQMTKKREDPFYGSSRFKHVISSGEKSQFSPSFS